MKYLHRKTEDGDSVIVLIPVKEILGEEDDDELEDEKDDGEGSRVGESDSDETTMHD
jgi:hypothetical protein